MRKTKINIMIKREKLYVIERLYMILIKCFFYYLKIQNVIFTIITATITK